MPADSYSITLPKVTEATISPQTTNVGALITVTATVIEQTVILEPVYPYSGTVFSGVWPTQL